MERPRAGPASWQGSSSRLQQPLCGGNPWGVSEGVSRKLGASGEHAEIEGREEGKKKEWEDEELIRIPDALPALPEEIGNIAEESESSLGGEVAEEGGGDGERILRGRRGGSGEGGDQGGEGNGEQTGLRGRGEEGEDNDGSIEFGELGLAKSEGDLDVASEVAVIIKEGLSRGRWG